MIRDICPIMSIGKTGHEKCVESCAWFDSELQECAISRLNGNTKQLEDIQQSIESIVSEINSVEDTLGKGIGELLSK